MKDCERCGKVLVSIGNNRENGKNFSTYKSKKTNFNADWDTRRFHKKCWIEIKKAQELQWKLQGLIPL